MKQAGKPDAALPIGRVLVAIDFSTASRAAFAFAIPLLEKWRAEVHLVHVFAPDYPLASITALPVVVPENEIERRVHSQLKDVAAQQAITVRRENIHVVKGTPFREICRLASELKIDLIVSATRGQTGLKHLALGSTAERVVRHAPCPVLIVHASDRNRPHRATFEKILAPTDFSSCGEAGVEMAKKLAQDFGAELVLIHSVDLHYYSTNPEFMLYDLPPLIEAAQKTGREQLAETVALVRQEKIPAEAVLGCGHAGEEICQEARNRGVDLIVIATHGRTGLSHVLLGSTAEYVVRHAPSPVLVIVSRERTPPFR
jgi:nucleotide-binding universal stress UspA family protein